MLPHFFIIKPGEHMHPLRAFQAFFSSLFGKDQPSKLPTEPSLKAKKDLNHLRLLSLLQEEGRLIDFLQEDLSAYSDEQVGKAIRSVHEKCKKRLDELVTIRPIFSEQEGDSVSIPEDYDMQNIKLVGNPKAKPPYQGILRHKGWKAHKQSLPEVLGSHNPEVIHPAEIEIGG